MRRLNFVQAINFTFKYTEHSEQVHHGSGCRVLFLLNFFQYPDAKIELRSLCSLWKLKELAEGLEGRKKSKINTCRILELLLSPSTLPEVFQHMVCILTYRQRAGQKEDTREVFL